LPAFGTSLIRPQQKILQQLAKGALADNILAEKPLSPTPEKSVQELQIERHNNVK
jgi:hypothetical protein